MKKSIFLLFSLIAIFFSACSTGDETTEIIINPVGSSRSNCTIKGKGVKNPDDNYESAGKLETTLKVLGWNEKKDVVFE